MIAYSKISVENFLVNKYNSKVLKYKGFRILRDLIYDNADFVIGNIVKEYDRIAKLYNSNWKAVERSLRYLRSVLDNTNETNLMFVNRLIMEFNNSLNE